MRCFRERFDGVEELEEGARGEFLGEWTDEGR